MCGLLPQGGRQYALLKIVPWILQLAPLALWEITGDEADSSDYFWNGRILAICKLMVIISTKKAKA